MPATTRGSAYFISPGWDFALVGGSSLVCFALLGLLPDLAASDRLASLSVLLLWAANWPHFSATLHRLYSRPDQVSRHPVAAYGLPLLFGGLVFAALGPAAGLAPLLVKTYLLWSPYHYSGQSMGITLLYARRSGLEVSRWERRSVALFAYACFFFVVLRQETAAWGDQVLGVEIRGLELPRLWYYLAQGTLVIAALSLAGTALGWTKRAKGGFPWIAFVPLAAQLSWAFAAQAPGYPLLLPFFHSLQYLLVVGFLQSVEARRDGHGSVGRALLRWARVNFVGGAFLFWGLPILFAVVGYPFTAAKAVLWSAVNLHHFVLDGLIWKLRNPKVSEPLTAQVSRWQMSPQVQ
jgi:hypothetical protein